MHPPTIQISLDLTDLDEALATAEMALRAGVDWLEAGTPLLLAHGLRAVEVMRERFPEVPVVADLKTMDGGYLEAEMMAFGNDGRSGSTVITPTAGATSPQGSLTHSASRPFGGGPGSS